MIVDTIHEFLPKKKEVEAESHSLQMVQKMRDRAKMLTLAHYNVNCGTIAWFMNRHVSTVQKWIQRSKIGGELCDKKRSGRPPVYDERTRLKTIAFYCQIEPLPGCSAWSLRWAENYLKEHPERVGYSMTHSTIQRILKSHSLRPHLHKYFLAITDPEFFPKMEHIVELYLKPPEYLFNFDECTALQAKSMLAPELPAIPNKPGYEEFEYRRNGTVDLMAFLNPKTGSVFGRCTPNHNTQTLIQVFKEHVYTLPLDEPIHYIMDNLNTHFNDEFCSAVADLSHVEYDPLKTGRERREWLQSEHKRIAIHFTPFHGSWLNMIEIWFGILNKKCLKHQSFESTELLRKAIEDFIEIWNTYFAHPFSWKYKGKGLHEKAINRFNKLLFIESKQMDITFLTKQLLLMTNIAKTYRDKVHTSVWKKLHDLVSEKTHYINSIINASTKHRQIAKANMALAQFRESLT